LYIAALAESIRQYRMTHGNDATLLFSFHGLPQRHVDLGDPYAQQCYKTVDLLAKQLNLSTEQYRVAFQSRFGKATWLQPYCDVLLRQLPTQGIKKVVMVCPGFAVDCLETLEEIAQRYQQLFLKAGGERFHYIPALNSSSAHSELLASIIRC
jgi:ferrochelatase